MYTREEGRGGEIGEREEDRGEGERGEGNEEGVGELGMG